MSIRKTIVALCLSAASMSAADMSFLAGGSINDMTKGKSSIPAALTEKEALSIKKHIDDIEANGAANASEYIMLGVTYEAGHKKIGIVQNTNKAIKYYGIALDKGIVYGGLRGSVLAYEAGQKNIANDLLEKSLENDSMTYEEGLIANRLGAAYALDAKKYGLADIHLMELASKFQDSEAALFGFNMHYYGLGTKKNHVSALKYVNLACNSKKITKTVANFCLTSPILQKTK